MPNVFPLNDFSHTNAHSCLPWDLLMAPFTSISPSPQNLFHLSLHEIPQTGHQTLVMCFFSSLTHTYIHTRAPPQLPPTPFFFWTEPLLAEAGRWRWRHCSISGYKEVINLRVWDRVSRKSFSLCLWISSCQANAESQGLLLPSNYYHV